MVRRTHDALKDPKIVGEMALSEEARLSTESCPTKASYVFGDVVLNDDEPSLCYSATSTVEGKNTSDPMADETERMAESFAPPEPTLLFRTSSVLPSSSASPTATGIDQSRTDFSDSKENDASGTSIASTKHRNHQDFRSAMRKEQNRPAARRDLVLKVRNAVDTASKSVNASLNASKHAKSKQATLRSNIIKQVRFQSDECQNEARAMQAATEHGRRKILRMKLDISSKHFKEKSKRDQENRMQQIAEAEKNYVFNSEVYRDHQVALKAIRDQKRRASTQVREKIRANNREGEEMMRKVLNEEDAAIFDARHDTNRAIQAVRDQTAKKRRESFAFRGGDARRIQKLRGEWASAKSKSDHESYELERAASKDAENYRMEMSRRKRESLAGRGKEFRRIKNQTESNDADAAMKLAADFELKRAGERDVDAYRRQEAEKRRKSIEGRNKESARHASVMSELKAVAQEKESEWYVTKFAAEADARAYEASLLKERRESLQKRGEDWVRRKEQEKTMHETLIKDQNDEGRLQSECHHDIEEYKKQCALRDRKSLEFRGKEFVARKIKEDVEEINQRKIDEENSQLETLARSDVREYVKYCKSRRRLSLAYRAKEKRKHFEWARIEKERELRERSEKSHQDRIDRLCFERAKQQELAKLAIDALLNAGCSINGNPFADILG